MAAPHFFSWAESTWLGAAIRHSLWLFPAIESVHLLGLCLIGGTTLAVDATLLRLDGTARPTAQLWRDLRRFFNMGLALMLATGALMFASEAAKLYFHEAFWTKMVALVAAVAFTFTIRRAVALSNPARVGSLRSRAVGALSIALWLTVAAQGRWIGYS